MAAKLLIVAAVDAERDALAGALGAGRERAIGPFRALHGDGVTLIAGGVGPAAAATATATALALAPGGYRLVVSAGLGGGFRGRAAVGELVEATAIVAGDLGAESPTGFLSVAELGFGDSVIAAAPLGIPGARCGPVLTLSTVTGSAERADQLAQRGAFAEAMEGFGVASAAARFGLPAGELRAISNEVGPRQRDGWDIPGALSALARAAAALSEVTT